MAQSSNAIPVYRFEACPGHYRCLSRMADEQGDFWRAYAIAEACPTALLELLPFVATECQLR